MSSSFYQQFNPSIYEYKEQSEALKDRILELVSCEKIFLIAATISNDQTEGLFTTNYHTYRHVSHYYILVVVPRADKAPNSGVTDKIESNLQSFVPTTAIVMDTEQFADWIKEGHPFVLHLLKEPYLLHGIQEPVVQSEITTNEEKYKEKLQSLFAQGLNRAEEFLAGADLFRLRGQNKMAAFMLHQSLEQMLRALMLIATGLKVTTHSLDKLIRLCSMFSSKLLHIFTTNDEKDEKLFQRLQKAYIDARYADDYCIKTDELLLLTERIRAVKEIYELVAKKIF